MSSVWTVSRSQSSLGTAGLECGASPAPGWGCSRGRFRTSSTRITFSISRSGEHSAVKKIFHNPSADFLKCGWTSTRNISMKELMILQSILEIFQRNVRRLSIKFTCIRRNIYRLSQIFVSQFEQKSNQMLRFEDQYQAH